MFPTLLIGDHIFVNKFVYGLRIPFTKIRVWDGRDPLRGEVIIFLYPQDESKDFIKRVVGLPGDRIQVQGHAVSINGSKIETEPLDLQLEASDETYLNVPGEVPYRRITKFEDWKQFVFYRETVGEVKHIDQYSRFFEREDFEATVPEGHYFVMGDNRDFSSDSREWGFVPRPNIKGRAMFVWLSINNEKLGIRIHRFGKWIY